MQKTCIVTGGSSGIGLATVKRFLSEDYRVFNLDIKPSKAGEFIACDVSSVKAVESAITNVLALTSTVDVLVPNAGVHFSSTIETTSEEDFDRVISINLKGAYAAIRSVLPAMKSNKKGAIILVGSDQSLIGKRHSFIYNLSKHAIASMAKTIALDYADAGIRANAVCPGTIDTPLYQKAVDAYCKKSGRSKESVNNEEKSLQPLNRIGTAEEVAAFIAFLASDDAAFITGSLHAIDGGYSCQ